ncbi:MAG TPA: (deoxy)nucleoside triphosphate pyrophosphohydrolase [Candidatus Acidoferrales bacterium]|nr:(deoxy)nucleoside triphosphate pyrophosphohydrolase [Candidatus Acidoferrales bacterium]
MLVVAALIEADGKVLVCQRRRTDSFGLMWEFPGGKVEPGESPSEALARELHEELGVPAHIGPEIHRTRHQYSELGEAIDLIFFAATVTPADIRNQAFETMEWRLPQSLHALNFLPADRDFVAKLAQKT